MDKNLAPSFIKTFTTIFGYFLQEYQQQQNYLAHH